MKQRGRLQISCGNVGMDSFEIIESGEDHQLFKEKHV